MANFECEPYFVAQLLRIRVTCATCESSFVGSSSAIQEWQSEHLCASADGRNPYLRFRNSSWIPILLGDSVDAAAAEFGNIQLFDSSSNVLRMEASRGFGRDFLAHFETVSGGDCACGTAVANGSRVIVGDVLTDPTFGEHSREIILRSNVRSVVSTPLLDRSRKLVGMLSVHSSRPQHFCLPQLKNIDDLIAGFVL